MQKRQFVFWVVIRGVYRKNRKSLILLNGTDKQKEWYRMFKRNEKIDGFVEII